MRTRETLTACLLVTVTISCGTSRPCSEAGDTVWTPEIRGDKHCYQKKGPDGSYSNHGSYRVTFPNGKTALEGEFNLGRKNGVWSQYNEKGEKIAERYYENGVEKKK